MNPKDKVNKNKGTNYYAVHKWLKDNFGKASKCENKNCKNIKPKRFEWALIDGKKYERIKNNFIQLCCSCHRHYDKSYGNIGDIVRGKSAHNKGNDSRLNKTCKHCGKKYKHYKITSVTCSLTCAAYYREKIKREKQNG